MRRKLIYLDWLDNGLSPFLKNTFYICLYQQTWSRFLFYLDTTFFRLNGHDMSNFSTYGEYRRAKNPDERPQTKISGNRPLVTGKRQRIAPPRYFLIYYNVVWPINFVHGSYILDMDKLTMWPQRSAQKVS